MRKKSKSLMFTFLSFVYLDFWCLISLVCSFVCLYFVFNQSTLKFVSKKCTFYVYDCFTICHFYVIFFCLYKMCNRSTAACPPCVSSSGTKSKILISDSPPNNPKSNPSLS